MDLWKMIGAVVMVVPLPVYFLLRSKFTRKKRPAGAAADAATFILFAAVPLSVEALWQLPFFSLTAIGAVLTAIILLYAEWKRTKELDVFIYFRKTWRVYFLVLFSAYVLIWTAGTILFIAGMFR
ncbi:DUF3397 family protein [Indiicoccus explosivorum]|uniref:DUF3397 family protein n=1 Tax=Indiicoccus explosivorum TaxID=1917864 RepID=UPI001F4EE949|nr:DUF3397 family protein [Indiicoccus explosivorum]